MAGSSSITGNQTVTFTDNMSFDGTDRGGAMTTDGQLWIGATASNRANDGGHVRLGNIISSDGSINVVNGAGSIDIRGQAAGFQPNAVIQIFDDFFPSGISAAGVVGSQLGWYNIGAGNQTITTTDPNHPGIAQLGAFPFSNGIVMQDGGSSKGFITGGGVLTFSFTTSLVTLSIAGTRYTTIIGLTDSTSGAVTNGIYFSYSDNVNTGQWVINCTTAGVTTSTNTTVVAITGFQTFTAVVNAAGTSVTFSIDGTAVGTIATNIPTLAITPIFVNVQSSGSTPASLIDLFWLTESLSNPRPGPISPSNPAANGRLLLSYTATPISYQVLGTDAIIGVTSTAAARTITMPNASLTTGQQWEIKDESGAAATNNITISGNGFNIDGAATYVINTNYGSVSIYWSGTKFFLV